MLEIEKNKHDKGSTRQIWRDLVTDKVNQKKKQIYPRTESAQDEDDEILPELDLEIETENQNYIQETQLYRK